MKKIIPLLFVLVTLLSCGTVNKNGQDSNNSETENTPDQPEQTVEPKTPEERALLDEYNNFDPITFSGYQKGQSFNKKRELSIEEIKTILNSQVNKLDKGILKYTFGACSNSLTMNRFEGVSFYNYKNALVSYGKSNYNTRNNFKPCILCSVKNGYYIDLIRYDYFDINHIKSYEKFVKNGHDYLNEYRYINGNNFLNIFDSFESIDINKVQGFELEDGQFLIEIPPTGFEYRTYEQSYMIFNQKKQLTINVDYYEENQHEWRSYQTVETFEYSSDNITPTKDTTSIEEVLKQSDHLYVSKCTCSLGTLQNDENVDYIEKLDDSYFDKEVTFYDLRSHYIEAKLLFTLTFDLPYKNQYNALLLKFTIEVNGILNGVQYLETISYSINIKSAYKGNVAQNKNGTTVVYGFDQNGGFVYISTEFNIIDYCLQLSSQSYVYIY